jgi:hypothetical protein
MAITDEESKALAEESRKSADAVERDYHELKGLIDVAKIDKEMKLLKEFSDNWNNIKVIDRELLSLAVENTNIKGKFILHCSRSGHNQLRATLVGVDGAPQVRWW